MHSHGPRQLRCERPLDDDCVVCVLGQRPKCRVNALDDDSGAVHILMDYDNCAVCVLWTTIVSCASLDDD